MGKALNSQENCREISKYFKNVLNFSERTNVVPPKITPESNPSSETPDEEEGKLKV